MAGQKIICHGSDVMTSFFSRRYKTEFLYSELKTNRLLSQSEQCQCSLSSLINIFSQQCLLVSSVVFSCRLSASRHKVQCQAGYDTFSSHSAFAVRSSLWSASLSPNWTDPSSRNKDCRVSIGRNTKSHHFRLLSPWPGYFEIISRYSVWASCSKTRPRCAVAPLMTAWPMNSRDCFSSAITGACVLKFRSTEASSAAEDHVAVATGCTGGLWIVTCVTKGCFTEGVVGLVGGSTLEHSLR